MASTGAVLYSKKGSTSEPKKRDKFAFGPSIYCLVLSSSSASHMQSINSVQGVVKVGATLGLSQALLINWNTHTTHAPYYLSLLPRFSSAPLLVFLALFHPDLPCAMPHAKPGCSLPSCKGRRGGVGGWVLFKIPLIYLYFIIILICLAPPSKASTCDPC